MDGTRILPFLKWAGGKRWLVSSHPHVFPESYGTYIEPFLGAGSVYFHLQPSKAILGDANEDLIGAYRAIKSDANAVERSLQYRQRRHDEDADYFYQLREREPGDLAQRASRLIYLNRTCFNGIYRVNRRGQFNVPRGTKDAVVMETDDFAAMSLLLKGAELVVSDFEPLINRARRDDLVFADPPYTVLHNYNGFVKYNEVLFSWSDQQRLATALWRAARRGVKVLCTNANHHSVRSLYADDVFTLDELSRTSRISADASSRKAFEELLIRANF